MHGMHIFEVRTQCGVGLLNALELDLRTGLSVPEMQVRVMNLGTALESTRNRHATANADCT